MVQEKAQVLWNRPVANDYYTIGLRCRSVKSAVPGQFVMLRVSRQSDPLLRRPFSIHRLIGGAGAVEGLELLYRVVGKGTRLLAGVSSGVQLDILGPLGSGFRLSDRFQRIFIAAGGIGVAPMVFLAQTLMQRGAAPDHCHVFLGGRTRSDLLCEDDFRALGMTAQLTTDDGSCGAHCLVTLPLETAVAERAPDMIYACGPMPMLACVVAIADKFKVACQVSLEAVMACGMGACLGCAVAGRSSAEPYLHVCTDGPVFDAQQLKFCDFPLT